MGPTFTIDVPSSPTAADEADGRLFLNAEEDTAGFRISGRPKFFTGGSSESESSSSIGTPDDSDNEEEEEEEEVESKLKGPDGLCSLDALEDSLPIKRGLSTHFEGKSKSFSDLSKVSTLKELQKQENPFNKRRRVLIASKWSRKSSFYSWSNPKSMPLFPVVEDRDDDFEEDEEDKARKHPSASSSSSNSSLGEEKKQEDLLHNNRFPQSYAAEMRLRLGSFKTRSFSLADLQEHDDEEEDDD